VQVGTLFCQHCSRNRQSKKPLTALSSSHNNFRQQILQQDRARILHPFCFTQRCQRQQSKARRSLFVLCCFKQKKKQQQSNSKTFATDVFVALCFNAASRADLAPQLAHASRCFPSSTRNTVHPPHVSRLHPEHFKNPAASELLLQAMHSATLFTAIPGKASFCPRSVVARRRRAPENRFLLLPLQKKLKQAKNKKNKKTRNHLFALFARA
jgi:hypothetical protein